MKSVTSVKVHRHYHQDRQCNILLGTVKVSAECKLYISCGLYIQLQMCVYIGEYTRTNKNVDREWLHDLFSGECFFLFFFRLYILSLQV